jgi:hypothetical protein
VPDADTQPIEVTANHPLSPVTITTSARDFRAGPADAGRRRRTGRYSAEAAAARGYLVRTTGAPPSPPRPVVDRIHAWLAVALVARRGSPGRGRERRCHGLSAGPGRAPVVTMVVTLPERRAGEPLRAPHHRTGTGSCHAEREKGPRTARQTPTAYLANTNGALKCTG